MKPCRGLSAAEIRQLDAVPVIDIHTHTFNARYLPLMNIALARAHLLSPPARLLLNDLTVRVLVSGLLGYTERNQREDKGHRNSGAQGLVDTPTAVAFGISPEDVARGSGEASVTKLVRESDPAIPKILTNEDKWRAFGEMLAAVDDEAQAEKMAVEQQKSAIGHFLARLVSSDAKLRDLLFEVYNPGGSNPQHVDLLVHHTMQMGATYGQKPGDNFLDFFPEQMDRVRKLDAANGNAGRFLHFVAFNPFMLTKEERDMPKGGWGNSRAITAIDEAIKRGAWGVKYYAPAGYRPSHNEIPERPCDRLLGEQWDARYEGFTNQELDELNHALFAYCAEKNVPILAHSQHGEFEALPGYGAAMSHPSYFRPILEEFRELRLCFGHAGGTQFWFSDGTAEERQGGEQVFELCTRFKNVYCEVGIFREVTEAGPRERFITNVSDLVHRPAAYSFGRKILYGTDWYMPNAIAVEEGFLARYQDVFRAADLSCHYRDFFGRNAVAFLDLSQENVRFRNLPPAIRDPIARLVTRVAE